MQQPGSLVEARKSPDLLRLPGAAFLWSLALVLLVLFSGCSGQQKVFSSEKHRMLAANALYDEAWQMIRDEYVDHTYNHQDWEHWRYRYQGRLQDPEDAYVAIGAMVASLNDEYTRFLKPRDMREQTMSIDSKLYGVGIQISMRDNKLVVVAPIEDTPADKAGLLPKDVIIRIDGYETAGMSVEDAADRIRGRKGTYVTLTIRRGDEELVKRIQRDEIKLKSVFSKDLDDKRIGYIRLNSFISENMPEEMNDIMSAMQEKQALIVDVRGNYGGLFNNAVEIADMFLSQGKIVSIVNRDHDSRSYEAQSETLYNKPLVVLIDGGSASASEILGGALKDNKRATLIGVQSFGKGLVQKINPLSGGAGLNITISKYLTPSGTDINKKGIAPDIMVSYSVKDFEAQRDPQLDRAIKYLEAQLVARK